MSEMEPDDLSRLDATGSDDKAFEDFCYVLIDHEVVKRHRDAEIDGPAPGQADDGGRDVTLRITAPPAISRQEFQPALTADEGEIWYACRTGHDWRKGVLQDAGDPREARGTRPAEPAPGVLRLLRDGGRYVVCVNRRVERKQELRDDLCQRLAFWIEARLGALPSDLCERIMVLDANDLARFVRHHRPALPGRILARLQSRALPHDPAGPGGAAQREEQEHADAWLEQHGNEPALHPVAAALIVRLGGTDQRMRWLLHMLATGTITARQLPVLGFAGWARAISTPLVEELFRHLVRGDADARVMALACGAELAMVRWEQVSGETRAQLASLLGQTAASSLDSVASVPWKRIALVLLGEGVVPPVIDAVVTFLENDGGDTVHPDLEPVLERLLVQGHADGLWRALAPRLASQTLRPKLARTELLAHVSPELVLAWVGEDEARAADIAALCAPWTERLGGVSRHLIERFGAESRPANVLLRRASCGPGRLRGVELLREQLEHARTWQGDASAEIARWARRAADELAAALAREEAEEALVRLHSYG
jgi:hypothetical protein